MTLPTNNPVKAPDRKPLLLISKLILLGLLVFAAGEMSWRMLGVQPQPSDLMRFAELRRAIQNSAGAVALIGSSRVHCDLDPWVLKREFPDNDFYQLGIDGSSALAMLENLAQDRTFCGHVLCEFSMVQFTTGIGKESIEQRYIRFFRRQPYVDFVGTWISESLSQHSVLLGVTDREFTSLVFAAVKTRTRSGTGNRGNSTQAAPKSGALAEAPPAERERFSPLHRRGMDNSPVIARWERLTRHRGSVDPSGSARQAASWVSAIRGRGGDVVFVRLPVSGSLKTIEDAVYPETERIVQLLEASKITVVDSTTEPTLKEFECADESHLDFDDAEQFSAALARILRDRQLLARAASGGH
jgi:hypothetical protein